MSTTTPNWTDDVSVIPATVVAFGESQTDIAALGASAGGLAKLAARLLVQVGRLDNTAIDVPYRTHIREITDSGITHPVDTLTRVGGEATAVATTVDANSNAQTLNVTNTTNFAAGDKICIVKADGTTNLEFHTIAKITNPGAGGELILVELLEVQRVDTDIVTNEADLWSIILPGGTIWDIIGDYGEAGSGPSIVTRVIQQTWDSLTTA